MPPLWKKAFYPTTASCAGKVDWSQINPNSELYFFPSLFMSLLHEILFRITVSLSLKQRRTLLGVPVRDYKKIQNILMGTPASTSNKEGSDFSESSLF